ncbi:hypothetical protein LZG04_25700 [Saccharothrix sp. S26]|uniref:hypothetical protein n=1 Tax=Saccharothrix sp. S26 TaxID=2907215 RepID=UPI001F1B1543|nr:hypothetical protein [Saccharothrix sp. S26]MCE6998166.1 hypothetical protein [Saccharothrix sp. S26]
MSDSGFAARPLDLALPGGSTPLTEISPRTAHTHPFELFRLVVGLVVGRGGMVLLSGPVRWRERPGAALGSRPADLAHSLGPRFSCVRLHDLFRGEHEDFVTVDEHGLPVSPDRRAQRSPRQRPLVIRFPEDFPLLIGAPDAVAAVASAAPVPPEVHRARDTHVDYASFDHLWRGPGPEEHFTVENLLRDRDEWNTLVEACEVGKAFGSAHRGSALVGDAPSADEPGIALVVPPTAAQCAADIAPLLPTMNRARWLAFRAGYLSRGPDGQGVVDLMEHGDASGWAQAARDGDWQSARALADAQLADGFPDRRVARACDLIGRRALVDPPAISADALASSLALGDRVATGRRRRWWRG